MRSSDAHDLLACPRCLGALDAALRCVACGAEYAIRDGVVDLRLPADEDDAGTESVRAFYSRSPFPNYPPHDSLASLRGRARRSDLIAALDEALPRDCSVLDLR